MARRGEDPRAVVGDGHGVLDVGGPAAVGAAQGPAVGVHPVAVVAAGRNRSPAEIAAASGVSLEALRKIESGRVPTPAFFTVAALASALGVPLDELVAAVASPEDAALTA